MVRTILILAFTLGVTGASHAGTDEKLQRSLLQLDPSTLVAQVCDLGAMKAFGRDAKFRRTDRVLVDAISVPKVDGEKVKGTGGAFRSEGKWYRFDYSCTLTPDHMKVVDFDYTVGPLIPEEKWSEIGLWGD